MLTGCSANPDASSTNQADYAQPQPSAQFEQFGDAETASVVDEADKAAEAEAETSATLESIPAYDGAPYVEINNNLPEFSEQDKSRATFEEYSSLDALGRCGVAFALVGEETMPTEERGSIGEVKPSGWHTVRYNGLVDGNYLYNRCHLLGYQLTGENANDENLITGTRYLNTEGMLPFENDIADYVDRTGNHVLYRVTPLFDGTNLVASGVEMEAYSVEDNGQGISFNVYCYNVQPGITIDYRTGNSSLTKEVATDAAYDPSPAQDYVLNTNSKKFHKPSCSSVDSMKESNRQDFCGTKENLIARGYDPCGRCNP